MTKKKASKSEDAPKKGAKKDAGVLPAIGGSDSGVPLHSFEASRGPIVSKATTLAEAHGIDKDKS